MAERTCSIGGCEGPVIARGWCGKHWWRWRKHGDPLKTVVYVGDRSPGRPKTCAIEGCGRPVKSRGWCNAHYLRWRAYGDPLLIAKQLRVRVPVVCSIEGCDEPHRARGYCHRHYENLRTGGDPVPRYDQPLDARLYEIGWTVTDSGCWEWNGRRNASNYGLFDAVRLGFLNARAHRVMYEHRVEPIPDGLDLRHKCDNPPCVNPDHLIPGTRLDNVHDMIERGRNKRAKCVNGHDVTQPGTTRQAMRSGRMSTICLVCEQGRQRRSNEREREKRKRKRAG